MVGKVLSRLARSLPERVDRLGRTDPLTAVGNRLAWDEALQLLQHDLRAVGKPHSIVLVGVDGHGHALGDQLLRAVAATLRDTLRGEDVVARIGGGEFAILMRHTDESACLERVERLRRALVERCLPDGQRVAATLGYGSMPPAPSLRAAQEDAEARLHEARDTRDGPPSTGFASASGERLRRLVRQGA